MSCPNKLALSIRKQREMPNGHMGLVLVHLCVGLELYFNLIRDMMSNNRNRFPNFVSPIFLLFFFHLSLL